MITALHPRLIQKRGERRGEKIGYLQRCKDDAAVRIGSIDSLEFRLVQSLFSPTNGHKTRFIPLRQTTERTYNNTFSKLAAEVPAQQTLRHMDEAVSDVLRSVGKTDAGQYLAFVQTTGHITMRIT